MSYALHNRISKAVTTKLWTLDGCRDSGPILPVTGTTSYQGMRPDVRTAKESLLAVGHGCKSLLQGYFMKRLILKRKPRSRLNGFPLVVADVGVSPCFRMGSPESVKWLPASFVNGVVGADGKPTNFPNPCGGRKSTHIWFPD